MHINLCVKQSKWYFSTWEGETYIQTNKQEQHKHKTKTQQKQTNKMQTCVKSNMTEKSKKIK